MLDPTLKALRTISLFSEFELEALEHLAKYAHRLELASEQVVFLEGEASEGLYVVESGWLKGSKIAESGREQVMRYFGEGDAINEGVIFLEIPNPATLIALEESVVWLVPRQALLSLVDEQPKLLWPLIQSLAKRLHYVVGLVKDLSLLPLEARLAKFLLEHASKDTLERKRWATQAELAARLGTVPDVLQRVLRKFTEAGLIRVERQQINILDREGLAAKAQQN